MKNTKQPNPRRQNGLFRCAQKTILVKLFAALAILMVSSVSAALPEKPNILMILVDDLGWSDLGCQGSTFYKTPNIDKLVAEGMRFTAAYASPSCSPTRASIMTGKSPARLHLTKPLGDGGPGPKTPKERGKDWPWYKYIQPLQIPALSLDEVTIAESLRIAGYETAIFGKWHLGGKGFEPEKQGFDINVGAGHYAHPKTYFSPYHIEDVISDGPTGEYLTDRLTAEAVKYIQLPHQKPFFIYMAHYAVHTPIQAKEDLISLYENIRDPLNPQNNAEYAAMIHSLDESVGKLMESLDSSGLRQNTLVVFVSDNGGVITTFGGNEKVTSNLPLRSGKGTLWEGGIRVPMIVRWPGVVEPGSVCRVPVICEDFYPTFCEMAGMPVATGNATDLDGESLLPLLENPKGNLSRDSLCWVFPHYNNFTDAAAAIREGEMKLVKQYGRSVELFNLNDDIGEREDLSSVYPELAQELDRKLENWLVQVGAWEMVENPNYDSSVLPHGLYPGFDPDWQGAQLVHEWNFGDSSPSKWTLLKKGGLFVKDGKLNVVTAGYAASIENSAHLKEPGTYIIQVRVREQGIKKGACILFWKADSESYDRRRRIQFAFPHDDKEHEVAALFRVKNPVDSLRIDPITGGPGQIEFDWIKIYKTDLP